MAKTLIGLYDTFTEAEQVVKELEKHGFSRSDIRLATHNTGGVTNKYVDYTYAETRSSTGRGRELINLLTDYGVPQNEADSYAEGVRRGGTLVVVKANESEADRGLEIMSQLQPVDIDERVGAWRKEGWNRFDPEAEPYAATAVTQERERYGKRMTDRGERMTDKGEVTIPVVEEELTVGKREVERGRVRIHTYIEERPVAEEVHLRQERVHVERHPVDRPATEADLAGLRNETIELTETAEEAVVNRRARVVEEVTVHTNVEDHTETVQETVRRTHVDVDQGDRTSTSTRREFKTYEADFQQHYNSTFGSSGVAYVEYEPAYRYGYSLGEDVRYRGRSWAEVESDARRDWEVHHKGTWERFKDAIRYGWNKVHA
jgi:uncharacterized protein (TIGR02271 family)